MILSGNEIITRQKQGLIKIEPFTIEQVNPHSYDVRLNLKGAKVIHRDDLLTPINPKNLHSYEKTAKVLPNSIEQFLLTPNELLIASTIETVGSDKFASTIWGKSSIGRLGVLVHFTAGYIDVGFEGRITLEVASQFDTILYDNMKIAQIQFQEIKGEVDLYKGKYSNKPKGAELSKYKLD